jgi:hypothetical protein
MCIVPICAVAVLGIRLCEDAYRGHDAEAKSAEPFSPCTLYARRWLGVARVWRTRHWAGEAAMDASDSKIYFARESIQLIAKRTQFDSVHAKARVVVLQWLMDVFWLADGPEIVHVLLHCTVSSHYLLHTVRPAI